MLQYENSLIEGEKLWSFCGLGRELFDVLLDWREYIPSFNESLEKSYVNNMSIDFAVRVKPELVQSVINEIGSDEFTVLKSLGIYSGLSGFSRHEKKLEDLINVARFQVKREISYRGCRTKESKRKKYDALVAELHQELAERKTELETRAYREVNCIIAEYVEIHNDKLIKEHTDLLCRGGWSEYVDERADRISEINAQSEKLKAKIKDMEEELGKLDSERKKIRNETMTNLLKSEEEDETPSEIREAMLAITEAGEGFESSPMRRPRIQ